MEIIRQGKPELRIKPSKPNTISCSECGCVFQYDDYDTHYATNISYDWEDEDDEAALQAESEDAAQFEPPSPREVPVLWNRTAEEEARGVVLKFPPRDPPSPL